MRETQCTKFVNKKRGLRFFCSEISYLSLMGIPLALSLYEELFTMIVCSSSKPKIHSPRKWTAFTMFHIIHYIIVNVEQQDSTHGTVSTN